MLSRTSIRTTVAMTGVVAVFLLCGIVQGQVHITAISPAAGQTTNTGTPELLVDFSGPINASTATTDSIRIYRVGADGLTPDSDDTPITLATIVAENGDARLRVTPQSPLADGDYAWVVYGSASSRSGSGNALYFSNNVAYLNLAALSTLGMSFTLEAWSRIDCCTTYGGHGFGAIFDFGQNGRNIPGVILEHQQANWRFYCRRPDGTESQAVATGGLVLGVWQHLAAVASPSGMKLYINGVLQASIPDTCNPSAMASYFQTALTGYTRWAGAYDYILGYFDDMRVWNVARSQAEIQACMHTPLAGNEPGLLIYHPLDETSGDVLTDVTGHGYNGTRGTAQRQASSAPLILMSSTALMGADAVAVDTDNDTLPGGVLVSTFHVDSTAPRVVDLTPAFDACPIVLQPEALAVQFSDTMNQTTLIAANIALIASGGDGIIGNGNDVAVPFTSAYDPATRTLTLTPGSPFLNELYRLTLADAIQNTAGLALDGEYPGSGGPSLPLPSGNGTAGGSMVLDFTIDNDFDCNHNGIADACELAGNDINGNGVPDDCEDCNGNGIVDECDLSCTAPGGYCNVPGCGLGADCNGNGVLDECEIGQTTAFHSGNGTIGSTDAFVKVLAGPADTGFANAFTSADFAAARSGPAAKIVSLSSGWLSSLPADPTAQWISTSPTTGYSGLFAIDFQLGSIGNRTARLDFYYAVDNYLGDTSRAGLYVNGTALSAAAAGGSGSQCSLVGLDVTSLVHGGTNTLYIYLRDTGGASGLLFSAKVTLADPAVQDCNGNGRPDSCDIADGTSVDCNADGIPDECWLEAGHQVTVTHRYRACIDGSSRLVLSGSTVQWHQLSGGAAAPGREPGCSGNQPTYVDEVAWMPDWPEPYPAPIRYDAYSSVYSALSPPYLAGNMTLQIHLISYRDPVTVNQYPSAANGYTIIIDIPDGSSGPFWYDFEVIATCTVEVDCNHNGILDECDIAAGTSQDCNSNGIPDECEFGGTTDCNNNGIIDLCEPGGAPDCNGNGIPDQCDIYSGTSTDCNGNGVPDECDMAAADWALDFDGDIDYVKVPRSAAFEPASELTIEVWVKAHGAGEQNARIVRKASGRGYVLAWEQQGDKRAQIRIDGATQGSVAVADTVSTDTYANQWHHLAATYSSTGNYVRLYVDGVLKNSAAAKGKLLYGTDDLYFGNWPSSAEGFDGLIDEVRIWNVARTQAQIQANKNRPLSGTEAGLVGYWRFNEGSGQVAQDSTPHGNNGRLGDATWADSSDPAWVISSTTMLYGDCNANGILDECDIAAGTSQDCNSNGIPDECEPDCNANGVPDACDIAAGTSQDCNGNYVPDECEPGHDLDCNHNGIIDFCEVGGTSDCNANGIPDLCDIYNGTSQDCNGNGVPDSCDIAAGTSTDVNANGIPDECEIDIHVVPVVTLIDPEATSEVRDAEPATMTAVVQGSAYYLEIWASDVGAVNTGLTGVYVDVNFCSATAASELFHGGIFTTFPLGTIQSGKVDEFGGSALPHGGGIAPQWVRVGWIRMTSGVATSSCAITLTSASNGIGAYTRGLINPAFIQRGSVNLTITPSQVSYDLDNDTYIGVGDLSLFAGSWLQTVPPAQAAHDFDCSDYVGVSDLSWFATGWQKYTNDPTILYPPCPGKSGEKDGGQRTETDIDLRLVALATPSSTDTRTSLPASLSSVALGQSYYIELWTSDVGDINTGLTSVYVDLGFPDAAASLLSIAHGGIFTLFPSGTDSGFGYLDELGGSNLPGGLGTEPVWVRVARVRLLAETSAPAAVFQVEPSATGVAALARGAIPWDSIAQGSLTLRQGVLGDVDSDGDKDADDLALFVQVLLGNEVGVTYRIACDFNGDNVVNGLDIQPFVNALLGS